MKRRVIGLISGTSVDGIDAALVELAGGTPDLHLTLLRGQTYPYPAELRSQILAVCAGEPISMGDLAALDDAIATAFANAAIAIQADLPPADLIGSHGQTVFHRPRDTRLGYSLQLGRGAAIAQQTGLPTVSNFRAGDIAMGGEGAPLVPKVDAYLLSHPQQATAVQNIGGIGNVTYLPPRQNDAADTQAWEATILGWDTGPGNSLLDLAVSQLSDGRLTYDRDGAWAAQGTPNSALVTQWLQQPFFQQAPPKSTGRELFGVEYLAQCVQDCQATGVTAPADILATLTDLTAAAIAHSYHTFLPRLPERVLVCGGGSKNAYIMQRLHHHLPTVQLGVTTAAGVDADFKEAIAFAVLADWRLQQLPGNLPSVTGAQSAALLGEITLPPP